MGLARGCGPLTWPRLGSSESGRGRRARVRGTGHSALGTGHLSRFAAPTSGSGVLVELDLFLLLCSARAVTRWGGESESAASKEEFQGT